MTRLSVGQVERVYQRRGDVGFLLPTQSEVVKRFAFDREAMPIPLNLIEIEVFGED
jgi:hypothetical protein